MRRLDRTGLAGMIAALWLTGLAGLGAAGQTPIPPSVVAGPGGSSDASSHPSCSKKSGETILCRGPRFDVTVKPFKFFQQMDLPPGKLTLLIGVLDRIAGVSQQVTISLTVPAKAGS